MARPTVTADGHRYRAQQAPDPMLCKGCAFPDGFGCALSRRETDWHPKCVPEWRKDGRRIIWVLDTGRA